jgi:hypothetical protein
MGAPDSTSTPAVRANASHALLSHAVIVEEAAGVAD